jgi:hypothetical protein
VCSAAKHTQKNAIKFASSDNFRQFKDGAQVSLVLECRLGMNGRNSEVKWDTPQKCAEERKQ